MADRSNPILRREASAARKAKRKAYENHFAEKVDMFLSEVEKENQLAQMTKTFRFIKKHKRNKETKAQEYIPIQQWEKKLKHISTSEGNISLNILEENDGREPGPEPTKEEIQNIIYTTRNNSAPGTDNIHNELLKYGSEKLLDKITDVMKDVFRTNTIPKAWLGTLQVPIPKIPHSQSVEDYRCITLCASPYTPNYC